MKKINFSYICIWKEWFCWSI